MSFVPVKAKEAVYYGGDLSYTQESVLGKNIIHFEVTTGWELDSGPCGANCSVKDVGTVTNARRSHMEHVTRDMDYYGKFTIDGGSTRDINSIVRSNYTELVIGVSEHDMWEQERLTFSMELVDDLNHFEFLGSHWSPGYLSLRSKVTHGLRSDTNSSNNSPQTIVKPYYRVVSNQNTTIFIPMIDPDYDIVRCYEPEYWQGLATTGVTIRQDETLTTQCKILIDAGRYSPDSWVAVSVIFQDYPSSNIQLDGNSYKVNEYSLGYTKAEFLLHIVDKLVQPEVVSPTKTGGHQFIVYSGAEWRTDIYAQASKNTSIKEFIPFGRNQEPVKVSELKEDTARPRVKYSTLSWTPSKQDAGQHIICVRVVDDTETESEDVRCFIVDVRVYSFNHSWPSSRVKPYFIDTPTFDQSLSCDINTTCLLPVFIKSVLQITTIHVEEKFTNATVLEQPEKYSRNGENIYKATLSISPSTAGPKKVCLTAEDTHNVLSEEVCINLEILFPDPCLSVPCPVRTTCTGDRISDTFVCKCQSFYYGQFCDYKINPCSDNPCITAQSYRCFENSFVYNCLCRPGYGGEHCEIAMQTTPGQTTGVTSTLLPAMYNCTDNGCSETQTDHCEEVANSFIVCICKKGFTGFRCEKADGCLPNPCVHGNCFSKGSLFLCQCDSGYTGKTCETVAVQTTVMHTTMTTSVLTSALLPDSTPCSHNPCVVGQTRTCVDIGLSYYCVCKTGFEGKHCEITDVCLPNPCLHGICFSHGSSFLCQCHSGYTGKTCDTTVDNSPSIVG